MMKIAVVTAYNPNNAGMYSVDLAALQFLRPLNKKISLFRAHVHRRELPFYMDGTRLKFLRTNSALEKADIVLYWGDFINSPTYAVNDFRRREPWIGQSEEVRDALERWKDLFLLRNTRPKTRKVISVSNNFQSSDTALDQMSIKDRVEITELYRQNFDGIYPRDQVSTQTISRVVGKTSRPVIKCGVDAAFLVRDHKIGTQPLDLKPKTYFTYFFNRSKIDGSDRILLEIQRATGLKPIGLDKWFSLNFRKWDREYSEMTTLMVNSAFLVSDTYHCCINAMTLRKPVIGLGRPADSQIGTLGDFKKKTLFEMFGMLDTYVSLPPKGQDNQLETVSMPRIIELAQHYKTGDMREDLYDSVIRQTETYRQRLIADIENF